ncbi:MAG: VOC family protein [Xanthomonadales bacterium]|nr:VOC family protein [Xanthomonadales bacterium]
MIEIAGIDHIVLRTASPDALVTFYRDVLGCRIERQLPAEIGLIQLRAGSALIDIVPVESQLGRKGGGPPDPRARNLDHLCLQVRGMSEEQLAEWLGSHGIEAPEFERRYGATGFGNSVYVDDPDGNTVELKLVD